MVEKSTHTDRITMYQPVVKNAQGKYVAILSDDSLDRDGEMMSKSCYQKVANDETYVAILVDHENKALNQIGEWTNKQVMEIDGHWSLVAEPKFYLSNSKAKEIKGMLDEGAKMGVSIGAIPKSSEVRKINGRDVRVYTDLEILEASFVAIPSNRHGMVAAVAKMAKKYSKGDIMSEELNKQLNEASEQVAELAKKVESAEAEIVKSVEAKAEVEKAFESYKADQEKAFKELSEKADSLEKALEEKSAEVEKAMEEVEKAKAEAEDAKQKALHKGNHEFQDLEKQAELKVSEALEKGFVPVIHNM